MTLNSCNECIVDGSHSVEAEGGIAKDFVVAVNTNRRLLLPDFASFRLPAFAYHNHYHTLSKLPGIINIQV